MNRKGVIAFFIFIFSLGLAPVSHAALDAAKVMEMTQGEFAMKLIKEAGASSRLSPGALGEDAINLLTSLGIVPDGGWEADKKVDDAFLKSLLSGSGKDASGTTQELLQKIESLVGELITNLTPNQNVSPAAAGPSS